MSFQERFKGKTSVINKDGLESSLTSNFNPINKINGNLHTEADSNKNFNYPEFPAYNETRDTSHKEKFLAESPMHKNYGTANGNTIFSKNISPNPQNFPTSSDIEKPREGNSRPFPSRQSLQNSNTVEIKPIQEFLQEIKQMNEFERNSNNVKNATNRKEHLSNTRTKPPLPSANTLSSKANSEIGTPMKRNVKSEGYKGMKGRDSKLKFNGGLVLERYNGAFTSGENGNEESVEKQGYKPYTLKEYQGLKDLPVYRPRSLGPNTQTEEWEIQKQKRDKMKDYSALVRAEHAFKLRNYGHSQERIKEEEEEEEPRKGNSRIYKSHQINSDLDIDFLNILNSVGRKH